MRKLFLLLAATATAFAACSTDSRGVVMTGLTAMQDNLLGPLTCAGTSPWIYGDIMEKAVIDRLAPEGILEAPVRGTALAGTVSWTGGQTITTTADQTAALSGLPYYLALAWNTVDGTGTGWAFCPVSSVTTTTITCSNNIFAPASSGITAYKMSATPGTSGYTFLGWDPQDGANVSTTWNYYDFAIGLYRYHYRVGSSDTTYLGYARAYADIQWQTTLDHGYDAVAPRAASMISQFFRVTEGHPERLPGLYNYISTIQATYGDITSCAAQLALCDNRESGYTLWDVALGAKVETDSFRHGQYCTWLATDTLPWTTTQYSDGSWGEDDWFINVTYPGAPRNYTDSPLHFGASPWRIAINVKAMEAAYESLSDTTAQGCNNSGANTALAAATLTAITNAVTWQHNYGRDTTNRGAWYTVGSASCEQPGCGTLYPGAGTVDATRGSPNIVGHGTNFQTAGYCDGHHFIGTITPWHGTIASSYRGVYKIASCTSDTAATLSANWGVFGESFDETGMVIAYAPAASSSCGASLSNECYTGAGGGDRNLTRTQCGGIGWLYRQTLNSTYLEWADECVSATLGGPTAGPTSADTEDGTTLPCSGPACDGFTGDVGDQMYRCSDVGNVPPCMYGIIGWASGNLGKNWAEAFGAPGIDNELGYRLFGAPLTSNVPISSKGVISGKSLVP